MADNKEGIEDVSVGEVNQHGIKVFGQPTGDLETKKDVNKVATDDKSKEELAKEELKKQETVDGKTLDKQENLDDKSKEAKEKALNPDNKDLDNKKESIKVDFSQGTQEPKKTEKAIDDKKQETASVTEEVVLAYMQKNGYEDLKSISELSKPVKLNEQVDAFKKYNDETGRGIKDFLNLQKDWKSEPKDDAIREFIKLKHPNLSDEDVENQLNVVKVTAEDEENLTPRELSRQKAEFNTMYSDAISHLTEKSKEYSMPLQPQQKEFVAPSEEDIAKAHRPYWKQRDKSLEEFKDIKFKIEGIGEITLSLDSDDKKIISERTETMDSMVNGWRKEDLSLDTDNLVKDNAWSIPSIRQKMITSIIEQVNTLTLDKLSKTNRGVDLDDLNKVKTKEVKDNHVMTVLGEKKRSESQQFGKPIVRQN